MTACRGERAELVVVLALFFCGCFLTIPNQLSVQQRGNGRDYGRSEERMCAPKVRNYLTWFGTVK